MEETEELEIAMQAFSTSLLNEIAEIKRFISNLEQVCADIETRLTNHQI